MALKSLFPSMFHRRLLLLVGLVGGGFTLLAAQTSRLTLARGETLLAEAEARLLRRQWTPTVRGSIVDRKGRVLAQDRPAYAVRADFSVISGQWARDRAQRAARRAAGPGWFDLSPTQREDLILSLEPAYRLHLEHAWNELATAAGVSRQDLDRRRDEILADVDRRYRGIVDRRLAKEREDALARGDDWAKDPSRPIPREVLRRAEAPIVEQTSSHILVPSLDDARGLTLQLLAEEEAPLALTPSAAAFLPPSALASDRNEIVPRLPGITIADAGDRDYPLESIEVTLPRDTFPSPVRSDEPLVVRVEGVATHVLGRLRRRVFGDVAETAADGSTRVIPGDASRRRAFLQANPAARSRAYGSASVDRGFYREGDNVGDLGVEGSQEHTLRGLRGVQTLRVDSGERVFVPAQPGDSVALTLDVMLQARVQALMSAPAGLAVVQPWHYQESDTQPAGTHLNGAAVVLDVDTGDILAMVSTPSFTRAQLDADPDSIFDDRVNTPFVNRAIAKPYPPGSIIKAMMLTGAAQRGVFLQGQRIQCTGHLLPGRTDLYRCWIYKRFGTTHSAQLGHELAADEALMVSCNIFFYTLGRRLAVDGVCDTLREYGLMTPFNLGAGPEFLGSLGSSGDGRDLSIQDAILMGIGQGPVAWTPLHAADAYATLARGGVRVPPRLIQSQPRSAPADLNLPAWAVSETLQGLDMAVSRDLGTGHHLSINGRREPIFNVPGVRVWGKTGTAEAPAILSSPDPATGQPREIVRAGDHSWFVVLVGRDRPRFAISVVIDYGGSGGKVSGPIVNQIIHALIQEGYL